MRNFDEQFSFRSGGKEDPSESSPDETGIDKRKLFNLVIIKCRSIGNEILEIKVSKYTGASQIANDQENDEIFQLGTVNDPPISEEAQANLDHQLAALCTAFEHSKLQKEAGRNWDRFYNRHGDKFFKV